MKKIEVRFVARVFKRKNKSFLFEFVSFVKEKKLYWMLPLIVLLVLVAILIYIGMATPVNVFIYPLA